MEKQEYQEHMEAMLSNQTTYEKLKKDPTRNYKAEPIRMINSLEKEGKITKVVWITKTPQEGYAT